MHYRGTVNAPVAASVLPWLLVVALLGAIGLAMLDPGKVVELLGDGRYMLVDGDALPPPPEPCPTVAAPAAAPVAVPAPPGPAPMRESAIAVQAQPVAAREAAPAAPRQVQGSGLPHGEAGLAVLIRAGVLRPGSPAEFDNWRNRHAVSTGRMPSRRMDDLGYRSLYTIIGPVEFPQGLTGPHAVVFILGEGAPYPGGDPGHSVVLDPSSGACLGLTCRMLLAD